MSKPLIQTTGRRKEAVARVRLRPGTGKILVNGREFAAYFPILTHQVIAKEPLRLTQTEEVYDVDASLGGGGVSGQAGAIRLGIARALALRPKFMVCDEPVSALDVSVGAQIINLLAQLQCDFGLTYLFISHSMPVVRYLSTRIAVMYRGRIVETGDTQQITERPAHPYTRSLLEATPELAK